MKNLSEFKNFIEAQVESYVNQLPDTSLHAPIKYLLKLPGKRIRPALTLLSGSMYDANENDVLNCALAIEVFHNFTLMHDDIMDNAPLRRGHDTVHEKWNTNTAILSGDTMLVEAYVLINKLSPHIQPAICTVFNKMAIEVCEGQQMDMEFESNQNVSEAEYLRMIQLKTSVLLGTALKMGAMCGTAKPQDLDHLYQLGIDLGMAFQLRDDYLDAFGDTNLFGKQKGGDILAFKKTILLIKTLDKLNTENRNAFVKTMQAAEVPTDEKLKIALDHFSKIGADVETEVLIEKYNTSAIMHLEKLEVPGDKKAPLYELSEMLLKRQH